MQRGARVKIFSRPAEARPPCAPGAFRHVLDISTARVAASAAQGRILDERTRPNGLRLQKITVPIGVVDPGTLPLTVTEKVTGWPKTDGFTDELMAVVVVAIAGLTVWPPLSVPLLPLKLASPL